MGGAIADGRSGALIRLPPGPLPQPGTMAAAPNGNGSGSGSGVGTVWAAFSKLDIVQEVLDRNRSLLEEIRGNHNSGGPDDLARNCVLIKELNGNISEARMGCWGAARAGQRCKQA